VRCRAALDFTAAGISSRTCQTNARGAAEMSIFRKTGGSKMKLTSPRRYQADTLAADTFTLEF
jgi:hypothetical protein